MFVKKSSARPLTSNDNVDRLSQLFLRSLKIQTWGPWNNGSERVLINVWDYLMLTKSILNGKLASRSFKTTWISCEDAECNKRQFLFQENCVTEFISQLSTYIAVFNRHNCRNWRFSHPWMFSVGYGHGSPMTNVWSEIKIQ